MQWIAFLTLSRPNLDLEEVRKGIRLPDGVWSQVFGDFGVIGSAEGPELLHHIFLSDLQHNRGTSAKVFNHGNVLRKDALVDVKELLSSGSIKVEHLHGRDFKTLLQNEVDDHACLATGYDVGLYQTESAIVHLSCGLHWPLGVKEEGGFSFHWSLWIATMYSVLSAISAKECS